MHEGARRAAAWSRAGELLKSVRIPSPQTRLRQHPHEMSGGMRQRIVGAIGISCEPRLLIADEPTTSLDVTIQLEAASFGASFVPTRSSCGLSVVFFAMLSERCIH